MRAAESVGLTASSRVAAAATSAAVAIRAATHLSGAEGERDGAGPAPVDSIDALCSATYQRLYAYLRARMQNDEDAADLTQQVYLQVLRAWDRRPADPTAYLPWLFRIARNAAVDLHRRSRDSVPWEALPAALQPPSQDQPEVSLLRREVLERLAGAVAALPAAKRDLLALRFGADLSYAEIGAVIGKREDAVKQQMSRLLRNLKEQHHAD